MDTCDILLTLLFGWSALMAIFALAILIIAIPAQTRDFRSKRNG